MSTLLTLLYHPDHWQSHGPYFYQIAGRLLDAGHLLLAEITCHTTESPPTIQHVGVYVPRVDAYELPWELAYTIPPLVITLEVAKL